MTLEFKVSLLKPEKAECIVSYTIADLYRVCITGDGRYITYDAILDNIRDVSSINRMLSRLSLEPERAESRALKHIIDRHQNGYGVLEALLMDDNIVDVFAISNVPVTVVHKDYGRLKTNIILSDEDLTEISLRATTLSGKGISERRPIPSFVEPRYFSRFSIVYRSDINARRYIALDIRKQPANPWSIFKLIDVNTMSIEEAAFLWLMVKYKIPLMVIGELFTGKTTTINALLSTIPPESRVFTIEDAPELVAPTKYWIRTMTREDAENPEDRITVFKLLKIAVRMSVDYIIVGEVRGEEARDWAQAVLVGHGGLTSFHASSPEAAITRLKLPPIMVPDQALKYLNIFIKMEPVQVEGEARLRRVTRLYVHDSDRVHMVFTYDPLRNEIVRITNPLSFSFIDKITKGYGLKIEDLKSEYEAMKNVIAKTMEELVAKYRDPANIPYIEVPSILYSRLREEYR
ncbi:MAG: type II/IV secretion system ATPase subunit [Acidilobaceae archaeon]